MMHVPFFSRTRSDAALAPELRAATARVLASGRYILGPEIEAFEREAAAYLGVRHAVGLSSGTDALIVALLALGIGPGDEVVVPAFTFVATAEAVERAGARVVFADVEEDTLCIDPESAAHEEAIRANVRATIAVHLFGRRARVKAIGDATGRPVIEDAAQAFGVPLRGVCAAHSFYPTKNLGGFGDGGMLATDDTAIADAARELRQHGQREPGVFASKGGNFRLDALQAAMLRVKLAHLPDAVSARRVHGAYYSSALAGVPGLTLPPPFLGAAPNQYTLRVHDNRRDALRAHLAERGIGTEVYYARPLHLQPRFADLGYRAGDFPVAERACGEVLSLPIWPELTADEVSWVAECVRGFYG